MPIRQNDALIVVDLQIDFLPGGALGVDEGDEVIAPINRVLPLFRCRVFSRDWHPPNHMSFAAEPTFRDRSWPPHCIAGTRGAEFSPRPPVPADAFIVSKATRPDREEYSAFQAADHDLAGWLRSRGADRVFVCGLATDYCVLNTALDARRAGFQVVLLEDAVRGVAPQTTADALARLDAAGVARARTDDLASEPAAAAQ